MATDQIVKEEKEKKETEKEKIDLCFCLDGNCLRGKSFWGRQEKEIMESF
jgi:hypothetical protein